MSIEKGKSSSSDESVQSDLFHIIDNLPWDAAANNHQRHSGSSPSSLLIPAIAVSNLPDPIPPSSLELLTEPQTALTSEDLQNVFISAVFQIGLKQSSPKVLMDLLPHDVEGLTSEIVKSRLQKCRSPRHYNDSLNLCLQDIQLKQQQQQMNASLYGDMKVESPADDQAGAIEEEQDSKRLRIDTSNDYRPHEQTEIPDDSELARLNHDLSQLQQENEHWSGLLRRFQSSQSESSQTSVLSHALSNNGGSFG